MVTLPFPIQVSPLREIFSTIAVAELDGDPGPELVFGTDLTGNDDRGMGLFAVNLDGTPVAGHWPVVLNTDVRSSPAVADLDRDCLDEVVVGTYGPPFTIRIYDHNGTEIGRSTSQSSVISSPAIGDLDGDGYLEIVIGTSDGTLKVMKRDGTSFSPAWPVTLPSRQPPLASGPRNDVDSSPALGDLDDDGYPDIVVIGDHGYIFAYNRNGQPLAGFPFITPAETYPETLTEAANFASPILGDVDGDGHIDVVAALSNARVYGLRGDGTQLPGFPIVLPPGTPPDARARPYDDILSTPALGDVDGDGLLELTVAFYSGPENLSRLYVYDLPGPAVIPRMPWPMFRGGGMRQGYFAGPPSGDSNRDGVVNKDDLLKLVNTWEHLYFQPKFNALFDFNSDGKVDGEDVPDLLDLLRAD